MNNSIIILLIVLIVCVDVLAVKHISQSKLSDGMKVIYTLIVILLPIIGVTIYYGVKR